jgi:hypothetical protein
MTEPPGCEIEDTWDDLQELRAVWLDCSWDGHEREDFEEDWDILQGKSNWFVALYDQDRERIPGTIQRTDSLSRKQITWPAPPPGTGGAMWIGYWSRAQPTVYFMRASLTEVKPLLPWRSPKLVGYLDLFTISTISSCSTTSIFTIPVNTTGTNIFTLTYLEV